ncbi:MULTISPECIES: hypothetical protein [Pseudomonas]|uniref:hypothetical protein n=1 Tax=Pseudomonas TaxID=286 RepID=UPI001182FE8C|nr:MULTISPECIES: hypothetical protein [Pseudomonas]MDD2141884.1 hypothetical protein [Pseudomonas putida]HDS1724727.1 hypothetical protein [Pseudomonas putida]
MGKKRLIIDTNLFLLLVIGSVDEGRYIKSSKRLGAYTEKDFQLVLEVMRAHSEVCLTSYIAAEVSNLIDLSDYARERAFEFAGYYFSTFTQVDTVLKVDCLHRDFKGYGITDCSLVSLASDFMILTNDQRMLGALYAVAPDNILPFELARTLYGRS